MKHIQTYESFKEDANEVSEKLTYTASQINDALFDAGEAFWASVASSFPEVKTGDFSPSDTFKLEKAMKDAITTWLKENG